MTATKTKRRARCRHCQERYQARPRGLCWVCFYRPGVRDLYPAKLNGTGRFRQSTVGLVTPTRKPQPTRARPGSAEKLQVLQQRAAAGEQLWHPKDAEE